jgi:hypothetical protein
MTSPARSNSVRSVISRTLMPWVRRTRMERFTAAIQRIPGRSPDPSINHKH